MMVCLTLEMNRRQAFFFWFKRSEVMFGLNIGKARLFVYNLL